MAGLTNQHLDLVEYLSSKGLAVHKAAGPEVTVHCPFCVDGDPAGKGKLYVNTVEGLFHCKRCLAAGNVRQLLGHYGDTPPEHDPDHGPDPARRRQVLADTVSFAAECLANTESVLLYLLGDRGLTPETILECRLGYLPAGWSLKDHLLGRGYELADLQGAGLLHTGGPRAGYDFYADQLLIPYCSRGQVLAVRGKQLGGKYLSGPGEQVRLFDVDQVADAAEVIITEGEFDAMALKQTLKAASDPRLQAMGVVALAGASAFPSGLADYFTTSRRIYLGLDPDEPGRRATAKLQQLLGPRTRVVELPDGLPKCDWTQLIAGRRASWRDIAELLSQASGRRLFTVQDAQRSWRRQRDLGGGLGLGYGPYDQATTPGLLPGHLMVILAKTGTGKTVFLNNVAYNTHRTPTLFLSLELTKEQVYEQLWRIYHFHHPYSSDTQLEAAFAKLRICDQNRLGDADVGQLLDEYAEDVGVPPGLVMVDYLGYFARGAAGHSPYEKTSNAVMSLKALAKQHSVPIIAPHQVSRIAKEGRPIDVDAARDSGVVEETADFLLSLYRPDDAIVQPNVAPSGRVRLHVNKSRTGGKGRTFDLQFSAASLVLVDAGSDANPTEHARQADHENDLIFRGFTYDQVRAQQAPVRQLHLVVGGTDA